MIPATLHRRLLAELAQGYPTRRRLARCGRLLQAALEPLPAAEPPPPPAAPPAAETGPMIMPACPTCHGTDIFASHARPGLHRCRQCGTEIMGETPA